MVSARNPAVYVVFAPNGCWIWTQRSGKVRPYPVLCRHWGGKNHNVLVHRLFYALRYGDPGGQLDHLCRTPSCVNPEHLEPVTARQNTLRGFGPTAVNAGKVVCVRGHRFDAANTYYRPSGGRNCRACHREAEAARRAA